MTADRTDELLERAIDLICHEWGISRAAALHWLNDEKYEWDHSERVKDDTEVPPGWYIQQKRTTVIERTFDQ